MNEEIISSRQVAAITLAGRIGKQIQKDHPEIANLYKLGKTQPEIVETLSVNETYGVESSQIAISAVCFALIGFGGNTRCEAYSGLINKSELETLCQEHRSVSGERMREGGIGLFSISEEDQRENKRKGGRAAKSQGKGIFALTSEQRGENARRSYEEGNSWWANLTVEERIEHGKKLHKKGIGIHKLTSDEKREAVLKSLKAQGMTPWSPEEDNYLLDVLKSKDYVILEKGVRERDYSRIVRELNERFHEGTSIRTKIAARGRLISLTNQAPSEELIALGPVSWLTNEESYILTALKSGGYTIEYKPGRVTYSYERLASELNQKYHSGESVRTKSGTRVKTLKLKKQISD